MTKEPLKSQTSLRSSIILIALALMVSGERSPFQGNASDKKRSGAIGLSGPPNKLWMRRAPAVYRVRFETGKGQFIVEAHRAWAPLGADRLYNLVRSGFFDDSRLFRIRAGYIAQFGIAGDPATAQRWRNQTIADDPVRQSNLRGFVAFAMTGPNTRTTQIYVNLVDNSRLDAEGFAPIGKIVEGMEIVDHLYAGYGEDAGGGMRAGKQGRLFEEGNKYLDEKFPLLDKLIRARIVPAHK